MTDIQILIDSLFVILAFYFVMKYLYLIANKSKPEDRQKIKKGLRVLIILYVIVMTIQMISLVDGIFFN
jgi:hypothetical protein